MNVGRSEKPNAIKEFVLTVESPAVSTASGPEVTEQQQPGRQTEKYTLYLLLFSSFQPSPDTRATLTLGLLWFHQSYFCFTPQQVQH